MSVLPSAMSQPDRAALYDAFISYSHAKDKPVAAALQSTMQKLGKPWYKRRALRVFRDDTSLAATPELWPTIEHALASSRYLIILASPEFAASKWCAMEVAYWLEHKSLDTLLVALTDGELRWNDDVRDFAWGEAPPLPAALRGRFRAEPKWIDLRRQRMAPNVRDAKLIDAAADLAAAVHGKPKEDLLSQEVRQQKRALGLAWSAATILLGLAAAAGWQWAEAERAKRTAIAAEQVATEQKVFAQKAQEQAEKHLALARKAAEDLVFKIAQQLRGVEGIRVEAIRQILETVQAVMDELVKSAPDDPHLQRSRYAMLTEFVPTYLAVNDLQRARSAAAESVLIMRRLTAEYPSNVEWQRDLTVALEKLGNVLAELGHRNDALLAYEECLSIRRKLVAAEPADARWHHDLSAILSAIGDVRFAGGDLVGALAAFQESLAIRRRLVAAAPDNSHFQYSLVSSLSRAGTVWLAQGDRTSAFSAFRESVEILRKLTASDPGNAQWQRELSASLITLGDMHRDGGDRHSASEAYREANAILRKLVASDSSNTRWQIDLSTSLDRLGDMSLLEGDSTGALRAYEESLAIRRKIAKDSDGTELQRNLSVSLNKIGDVRRSLGDRDGALAVYEEGLTIARRLAGAAPGPEWTDVAFSLYKVSTVSEPRRARGALREAIAILERLEGLGMLSADQREWPRLLREVLAKLPPETGHEQDPS